MPYSTALPEEELEDALGVAEVRAGAQMVGHKIRCECFADGAEYPLIQTITDKQRGDQNEYRAEDRGPRQIVCAVTENLWHRRRVVVFRLTADLTAITVSGGTNPPLDLSIQIVKLLSRLL